MKERSSRNAGRPGDPFFFRTETLESACSLRSSRPPSNTPTPTTRLHRHKTSDPTRLALSPASLNVVCDRRSVSLSVRRFPEASMAKTVTVLGRSTVALKSKYFTLKEKENSFTKKKIKKQQQQMTHGQIMKPPNNSSQDEYTTNEQHHNNCFLLMIHKNTRWKTNRQVYTTFKGVVQVLEDKFKLLQYWWGKNPNKLFSEETPSESREVAGSTTYKQLKGINCVVL